MPTRTRGADEQRRRDDAEHEQLEEPEDPAGGQQGDGADPDQPALPGQHASAYLGLAGRDGHGPQHLGERVGRVDALELGLGGDEQPVGEHRLGQRLEVVGHDVAAAAGGGPRPGDPLQARAWRAATCRARGAGGGGSRSARSTRYAFRRGRHVHRLGGVDHVLHVVVGDHRADVVERVVVAVGVEDLELGVAWSGSRPRPA